MDVPIDRLVRDAIRSAVNDPICYEEALASGGEVTFTDENRAIVTGRDRVPIQDREEAEPRLSGQRLQHCLHVGTIVVHGRGEPHEIVCHPGIDVGTAETLLYPVPVFRREGDDR